MLADQLDYVVGVDPHRDSHALAVVQVVSGAVVFEANVAASSDGYAQALQLVDEHAPGSARVRGRGHRLVRCRPHALPDRSWRAGARGRPVAAGAPLGRQDRRARRGPCRPQCAHRASGLRHHGRAGNARRCRRWWPHAKARSTPNGQGSASCATCLITTPEPLRSELRPLTRARLLQRLAATRPDGRRDLELRGSLLALRSIARRVLQLTAEERELAREIETHHAQARAAAARPARRRSARRRSACPLLVTPRPDRIGSRVREARRRSTDPRLLRPDSPLPPRPQRRPQAQPRAAHDPRHTETLTPRHDRLHRTASPRRQDPTRGKPLPQALPRPQPLPATRTRTTTGDLTDIEASLAACDGAAPAYSGPACAAASLRR